MSRGVRLVGILAWMAVRVSNPQTDVEGLENLAALWVELHRHHLEVSDYSELVHDFGLSWQSRLRWYRRLLEEGGCYLTATDDEGRVIGYAMVGIEEGPDDTFEVTGGTAEIVTLVVTRDHRSEGVGRALLDAAEAVVRDHGFDTVKVAVMSGNARAREFYEKRGYSVGEYVLYRRLDD